MATSGAGSSGSALFEACNALREKLARAAGIDPATATFANGSIASGEQSRKLTDLVGAGMDADGEIRPGRNNKEFSQQSYGAHFAEVGVDADTGEVRLRRMLGVFTAGRVLNAKTARSQAIGGMVFGVGAALHEEMALDPRFGYFVNHDLAEYHVAVHADIPAIDAIFLAELDEMAPSNKVFHDAVTSKLRAASRESVAEMVRQLDGLVGDLDANQLAEMLSNAKAASRKFAAEEDIEVSWERIWNIEPILFDGQLIELADEAITEVSGSSHRLPSGPLHDAAEVARAGVPTVMLFVQSLRGLSHTKLEDTKEEHLELSVQALDRLASKALALFGREA